MIKNYNKTIMILKKIINTSILLDPSRLLLMLLNVLKPTV